MSDKLRMSMFRSSHDYEYTVRGMEVVVNTSIYDRDGEESDNMQADVIVSEYDGRVYTQVSHVPTQRITRQTLLDIATAFQEFARIAGEMEDAVKDIDQSVIAECKAEMDAVDKEYSAIYREIENRKTAIRVRRMAAYQAALSDKDYGIWEYNRRKPTDDVTS